MRKSVELAQLIAAARTQVENHVAAGNLEDAQNKAKELKDLKAEYDAAVAVEESKKKNFNGEQQKGITKMASAKVAFNKAIRGMALTDEEKALVKFESLRDTVGTPGQQGVTPSKGGYLVPAEQASQIEKLMDEEVRLKNYCTVRETNFRSGSMPSRTHANSKLVNFDELNTITEKDIDFGQITYECKNYGAIIPISNELIEDASADVVAEIAEEFAQEAVDTENDKILTLLNGLTGTAMTDYKDIKTALNVTLKPAVSKRAIIITNQNGFDYLDKLEDDNGQPILSEHMAQDGVYKFRGKDIVVLDNAVLPDDNTDGTPFFVGSLRDFCLFAERKGLVVAISQEAGFTKNATLVRAITRFDVKTKFGTGTMVKLTYKAS